MRNLLIFMMLIASAFVCSAGRLGEYVDPRIGSEGLGRVFIGPSMPFGMVRPGPDCTVSPNSGWLPMPAQVNGFAQVHVSGTGGGPKYGNILIQPFIGKNSPTLAPIGTRFEAIDYRDSEEISLGYYATKYKNSGIFTEITTTPRASAYRIAYPPGSEPGLVIDAGFFLGEHKEPDVREAQQFVGSQIQVVSDSEVRGYNRVRGGWNNGKAYTVYFCLMTDKPAVSAKTWKSGEMSDAKDQVDSGEQTGAVLRFADCTDTLNVRIGISFISELKAKENLEAMTSGKSFEALHEELLNEWEALLTKIKIDPKASSDMARHVPTSADMDEDTKLKRMFYTALYHTMIMPSDRTGENPLWNDNVPYYDDFYAIWDTYRSSSPLITLIDPQREADIVNSLINIWKRDGYMPDARSGNSNGRTQGGSNAEIVLADAFVKGLEGIDWEEALKAMCKDAEVDPGDRHEAEGRGGLNEYLRLGYVPYGIDRAGNRTVEYSYCDYAIYEMAKGLGYDALADKYLKQSGNWKNLWRDDYEHDGTKGFIMPRDAEGRWLDELPYGHSAKRAPMFRYYPMMFEGPWYKPWWGMFFYEASSWEYSLSIPHDVEGLIEKCGGPEAFEARLDKFFDKKYFNVNNEPSFLTPCLYHWIGKPERTSDRVLEIIAESYDDTPKGLPGNDDSGAMSSWLAFHMMGLYPNAGQDYYLIHTPLLRRSEISLPDGGSFVISADNLSDKNRYIESMTLNSKPYDKFMISHADLMKGGELKMKMGKGQKKSVGTSLRDVVNGSSNNKETYQRYVPTLYSDSLSWQFVYKLHGQTRRFKFEFEKMADGGVTLHWGIERNLKWWQGSYRMTPESVENGNSLSFRMPEDGNNLTLLDNETFAMISRKAFSDLTEKGEFEYDGVKYFLADSFQFSDVSFQSNSENRKLKTDIYSVKDSEGAQLWILNNPELPIIVRMQDNPLEIDWKADIIRN